MEAHSKVVLNGGSQTRATRGDQSAAISTPDASLVDMAMAHHFSWETIPELGSDHVQLLLIWDKYIKVEHVHTRRRPNYPKADLPLFHKCFDNNINAVLSDEPLSRRALCILLKRADSEAIPIKAARKKETPWMNAHLKLLIQTCNTLCRDLRTNSGWRRTVRSPDSQKNPSWQSGTDT